MLRQGEVVFEVDLMIASIALVHDLTLVTNNTNTSGKFPACDLKIGSLPEKRARKHTHDGDLSS